MAEDGHKRRSSVVKIEKQGSIEGVFVDVRDTRNADSSCTTITAYLGIPFAQPPVGQLRWKRPQRPAPSWKDGTIRLSAWKCDPFQNLGQSDSLQKPRRNGDESVAAHSTISEDCLYLNVWVPPSSSVKQSHICPVLVWVYGGAFGFGAASQPAYDGARLCKETGCVVVSITYRVGPFGWLGSRELARSENRVVDEGEQGTGNYGAWDVIAALEWIKENIKSFSGDSSNVTIFGESAGSILIHYLLISPATPAHLFQRAILQSGTATTILPRTIPSAQATFDAIALGLGASTTATDAEKMSIMYSASASSILETAASFNSYRPRTEYRVDALLGRPERRLDHDQDNITLESSSLFGPVWDGTFVSKAFIHLACQGLPAADQLRNGQKGIIVGYCADEGSIFNPSVSTAEELKRHVSGFHPQLLPDVRQLYGIPKIKTDDDAFAACAAYTGDVLFDAPIRALMLQLAQRSSPPSHAYVFAHRRKTSWKPSFGKPGTDYGAMHMAELPFIFGFDGMDSYVFERDHYPGAKLKHQQNSADPFTREEQDLSLKLMSSISKFTRDEKPWIALSPPSEAILRVEDCQILAIGGCAKLGSHTTTAVASLEALKAEKDIPFREERLGDNTAWTEKVGPVDALAEMGSQAEKQDFWTQDGLKNIIINYYGDERIHFLP
ncbi:hypothetical protein CBS101457_005042 [Exobasidium rhododendri]|nr:hypothetical protein CBS101457_005042 [Exobasidium rhododendri]